MFKKKEPQIILVPGYKQEVCKVCAKPLKWGDFAYNQEVCWDCFKRTIIVIAKEGKTLEDTEIILHLLSIAEHHYNIPKVLKIGVSKPNDYYWNIIKSFDEYTGHAEPVGVPCTELGGLAFALNMPEDSLEYVLKELKLKVIEE